MLMNAQEELLPKEDNRNLDIEYVNGIIDNLYKNNKNKIFVKDSEAQIEAELYFEFVPTLETIFKKLKLLKKTTILECSDIDIQDGKYVYKIKIWIV